MSNVETSVDKRGARGCRLVMRLEIAGRSDDGRPEILGYADYDHVPLDELPEMNAGVEPRGDEVDAALVGGHVEHDVGVIARELSQLRGEHRRRGKRRHDQTHATGRPVTQPGNQVQRFANVAERRA